MITLFLLIKLLVIFIFADKTWLAVPEHDFGQHTFTLMLRLSPAIVSSIVLSGDISNNVSSGQVVKIREVSSVSSLSSIGRSS